MKKIGLIYRYSEKEEQGILVYGSWTNRNSDDKPLKFTIDQCNSSIKTGQLVYFEFENNKISNIQQASLSNFDKDLLINLITEKEHDISIWYYNNTHIEFSHITKRIEYSDSWDYEFWDLYDESVFKLDYKRLTSPDFLEIPIDELYQVLIDNRKVNEKYQRDGVFVDIFDLSLWINEDIIKGCYFGMTGEEASFLCDLFVYRKRYNNKGELETPNRDNDCISDFWKDILSKLNNEDLRLLIKNNPILQPALREDFCLNNLNILTDKYGMPSINVCKSYIQYHIERVNSATEYNKISYKLLTYANCGSNHLDGEGTPMCRMGKKYIAELSQKLDKRFNDILSSNLKHQFAKFTNTDFDSIKNTNLKEKKEALIKVGIFIEDFFKSVEKDWFWDTWKKFERVPKEYKDDLLPPAKEIIGKIILNKCKNCESLPSDIKYLFLELKDFVDSSLPGKIKPFVNLRFAELKSFSELKDAYELELISSYQFYNALKKIIKTIGLEELVNEFEYNKKLPLSIKWLILSRIINICNYKNIHDFGFYKLGFYSIHNLKEFIHWIKGQFSSWYSSDPISLKAQNKILSILTEKEKWQLFEENLVYSPGELNIRHRLSEAYKNGSLKAKYFEKECFQRTIYEDAIQTKNLEVKFFLIDHLNNKYLEKIKEKNYSIYKFYNWAKEPNEDYDWNLISRFFVFLPEVLQFQVLRYIFLLIEKKELSISINTLFSIFVNSENKACPIVSSILYLLYQKILYPEKKINTQELNKLFGKKDILNQKPLLFKDFFYSCEGYLAVTHNRKGLDVLFYNGYIEKILIEGEHFYVISFYNYPHDVYNKENKWVGTSNIEIAKSILIKNFNLKENNGKYLIATTEKIKLSFYVMDHNLEDHCGLLDNLFEKDTYYQKNSRYQPLYTNIRLPYDYEKFIFCRDFNILDSDTLSKLPFYWCKRKPCVRRGHYFLAESQWKNYKFQDFLYILLGCKVSQLSQIWKITSEVSNFLNNWLRFKTEEEIKISQQENRAEEIGVLTEEVSVVQDIPEEYYEENSYDEPEEADPYPDYEESTYDRYGGSYAQDEMGYSDDDIDTIFDGDPNAYWNID